MMPMNSSAGCRLAPLAPPWGLIPQAGAALHYLPASLGAHSSAAAGLHYLPASMAACSASAAREGPGGWMPMTKAFS